MRNGKKKLIAKLLSLVLCAVMMTPLLPTTVFAAYTATSGLPGVGGTLYNGYIYKVSGNPVMRAGSGTNALNVQSGAVVVLYIPSGSTLTVYGGSGNGSAPGGAGIYIPSNSSLLVTGGGRLVAYGGDGGYPGGGYSGSSAGYYYGGSGGTGGSGGGGSGAGIGGYGGWGGSGGSGPSGPSGSSSTSYMSGNSGNSGNYGSVGGSMGYLYILGTVTVQASAGSARYASYGGGSGGGPLETKYGDWWKGMTGGGGGGAGGSGGQAANIGGGAGGGGGGGAGGSGTIANGRNGYSIFLGASGGGGGGGAANYFGYAGSYSSYSSSSGTLSEYKLSGNSGSRSAAGGAGGSARSVYGGNGYTYYGSAGGRGGSYGAGGSGGVIYKAPTATLAYGVGGSSSASGYGSGAAAYGYSGIPNEMQYNIRYDQQGGTGGAANTTIAYGTYPPSVPVPVKDLHAFMGYYTAQNGAGTRYYDYRGAALSVWESTSDISLYAYWVQNRFNITFNKQTGTGGSDSTITTGTDGTLPNITPPSKDYFLFRGYYDKAAGAGTQYYDSVGTPVNGKKITANSVLYAFWQQNQFCITFSRQGGTGGSDRVYTDENHYGGLISVTPPTRQGAAFDGYYTQSTGGEKIYNADGSPVDGKTLTAETMLYAHWKEAGYNITYELNGGNITGQPTSRLYTQQTVIPAPSKEGYTFLGWQVDDLTAVRHRNLIIPARSEAYAKDIALTAIWAKGADTDVQIAGDVVLASGNENELRNDLSDSFDTVVSEADKGITADDLAGDKQIKLILSVASSSSDDDHTLIGSIAQGAALSYYDITARKEVFDGTHTEATTLLEIPEPIEVKIPIPAELAGKTAYRVYRVHDGVAEPLPSGPTSGEYYMVENGTIVIRTRKFSTYGVVGAESEVSSKPGDIFNGGGGDVDVQGRVIEGAVNLIYKIDIAWGAMKFEYSMDKEWDPDTHMYTEGSLNAWRASGFDGENNRIRSVNHSNGAVKLNLAVTKNDLQGVSMSLHLFNELTATPAPSFILPPAPIGSMDKDLEPAAAYLFLSGSPQSMWIDANKDDFSKVAVVTVTVEPHTP